MKLVNTMLIGCFMLKGEKMKIKNLVLYIITVLISAALIFVGYNYTKNDTITDVATNYYIKAVVLSVDDNLYETPLPQNQDTLSLSKKTGIVFTAQIISQSNEGEIVQARQMILYEDELEVSAGDKVLLVYTEAMAAENGWYFSGFYRFDYAVCLIAAFLLLILIIGKLKGVSTIISLILTCAAIFAVFIPGILKGINIYYLTVCVTLYIIIMSIIILNGFSKKTFCAIMGNICGVAISAGLALFVNGALKVTGLVDQEYIYLTYINPENPLNLKALVWAGIVIGSLGAIMDIAVTLASSVKELSDHMEEKRFMKLFKSGMNIGKDTVGTMTNTLILAYIGSSMAMVLLFVAYNHSFLFLLNLELIIVEIAQAVVGSIGILAAVPMTVGIASYVFSKRGRKH